MQGHGSPVLLASISHAGFDSEEIASFLLFNLPNLAKLALSKSVENNKIGIESIAWRDVCRMLGTRMGAIRSGQHRV
jgi:hypothetical protein